MRTNSLMSAAAVACLFLITPDFALAGGQPEPWQLGFQEAATPMMREITSFHNLLLGIIFATAGFVLLLLLTVMVRFNAKSNPVPAKFSHNTLIEVAWTVVPILILVVIAIPSFRLLYYIDQVPAADMTLKVTGYQWSWGYQYPDHLGDEEFIANMVPEEDLGLDPYGNPQPRLLASDFNIVVPVGKTVRVVVTGADVIHNWALPSFGVKIDAVPGRLNETWFRVEKEGMYYGQCSELCGQRHAFMPIAVQVVSEAEFERWVAGIREEYGLAEALAPQGTIDVAAAQ